MCLIFTTTSCVFHGAPLTAEAQWTFVERTLTSQVDKLKRRPQGYKAGNQREREHGQVGVPWRLDFGVGEVFHSNIVPGEPRGADCSR